MGVPADDDAIEQVAMQMLRLQLDDKITEEQMRKLKEQKRRCEEAGARKPPIDSVSTSEIRPSAGQSASSGSK